jgi:hypothetical protein
MAIDFNKMKQKLNALQGNGNGNSTQNTFWKPQDGDQTIRIVCPEDGDPFKQYYFHYNVGKNPGFLCPKKMHGKDCPVCNFAWSTYNDAKAAGDTETLKFCKTLFAKERFFSPVVVRGEEDQGIRLWGYGKTAYGEMIGLVTNPDYGDITDVNGGTDLTINYGKPPGAQFPVTKITPRRRPSALAETSDEIVTIMDSMPSFTENFNSKTTEEIETMLSEFLNAEAGNNSNTSETTKYSNNEASDVDAAFNELLS